MNVKLAHVNKYLSERSHGNKRVSKELELSVHSKAYILTFIKHHQENDFAWHFIPNANF